MSKKKKEETPVEISCREAGRRGGAIMKAKYGGTDFYSKIGQKGGATTAETHGTKFYQKIGKKGGRTTSERHGPEFYEKIGQKGGQRVKELIAKAKEIENS